MKTICPQTIYPADELHVQILDCQSRHLNKWVYDDFAVPYWRLYWNKNNGAAIFLNSKRYPLQPAYIYLIPPNAPLSARLFHPVDHFYIHFAAEYPYDKVMPLIFKCPVMPAMVDTFQDLSGFLEAEKRQKKILSARALFLCYYGLSRVPLETLGTNYADPRIMPVIAYIDNHRGQPMSNAILAGTIGMHPTAFIRFFKKCTGFSPQAFSRMRRIEQACYLLHFSSESIDSIAFITGFFNRYHFSLVFKKIRGISPAKFRRLRYNHPMLARN